jgi:hypothetical protein
MKPEKRSRERDPEPEARGGRESYTKYQLYMRVSAPVLGDRFLTSDHASALHVGGSHRRYYFPFSLSAWGTGDGAFFLRFLSHKKLNHIQK